MYYLMVLVTSNQGSISFDDITIDGCNSTPNSFALESTFKPLEFLFCNDYVHSNEAWSAITPFNYSPPLSNGNKGIFAGIKNDAKSNADKIHLNSNMSLAIVCVLAMGLRDGNGSPILEPTMFPWTEIKAKKKYCVMQKEFWASSIEELTK